MNLFLAELLLELAESGDACSWYFVTLCIDTLFGIVLCWGIHKIIDTIAIK